MSFLLENSHPHPQPKKSLLISNLLGDNNGFLVPKVAPVTLDLFDFKQSPPRNKFHPPCPVARGTCFLNDKSKQKRGLEDHKSKEKTMSRRNGNNVPKLDLKLNLSPPNSRMIVNPNPNLNPRMESPSRSASVSPPSSCVSSDVSMSSPEATSMVLVGCPRCLMYVMLSEDDPKCPKCKSTVLLDFVHDNDNNNNNNDNNNNSKSGNSGSSKKTKKG
ncbi:homeobox protein 6-like [Chenopodium quinoa]|uniref:homeobox protein 6-like n=1 Tax=Chenopodium quinoa TaxID=63459 RepID=UPI000B792652|nr:homeobox protein 6-like [Chenopodium quinoa]